MKNLISIQYYYPSNAATSPRSIPMGSEQALNESGLHDLVGSRV